MTAATTNSQAKAATGKHWVRVLTDCGHRDTDGFHERRQKSVITGASVLKTAACPVWIGFFLLVNAPIAAAIPGFYALFTWLSIGALALNQDIAGFRTRQAWLILLLPAGVTLALGGLFVSGAIILWSFLAPLIALLFHGPRSATRWLFAFFALVLGAVVVETLGLLPAVVIAPTMLTIFTAMNVIAVTGISYAAVRYYALLLEEEQTLQKVLNERIDGLENEVEAARKAGSYRLIEKLGEGGMGEVWRAQHAMLARPAAVKLVRPKALDGDRNIERAAQRFEREAQATATLSSVNTVEVYDFGRTDEGDFYYVMELLNGLNLEDLVERFGPLESPRVAYLLAQACDSLHEAHEAGLIHRDIKPANLFACRRGNQYDLVKVLDFGLVKAFEEAGQGEPHLTAEGVFAATPCYTSPESVLNPRELDGRSDLYLLGCVGYWLLTGSPPFEGDTAFKLLSDHAAVAPVPPSERTELPVDPELEAVILRCMEKSPADRPAHACALRAALLPVAARGWDGERARAWWEGHHPLPHLTHGAGPAQKGGAARFLANSDRHTVPETALEATAPQTAPLTDEIRRIPRERVAD